MLVFCVGKGLLETDLRPNDNYALLAAHLIIDIAVDLGMGIRDLFG